MDGFEQQNDAGGRRLSPVLRMPDVFWQGRPTFVTGATGLMGSWLLQRLVAEGADVVSLVRDGAGPSIAIANGFLRVAAVQGCVEDFDLLRRSLSRYAIDTVFHLAAQPLVGVARQNPLATLETNIRGTWNVLEAARVCGVRQVVIASSYKAYGATANLPYTEDHPLQGTYPYDVSKSCADLIATMYATSCELPVAIVRCANLFGGGDLNFSRTIPGAIQATLEGKRFVIRSDGRTIRDYLYVKDAASAYLRVAQQLAAGPSISGEAFNFGLGLRVTVLDLAHQVLEMMGRDDLEPIVQNRSGLEIREQYLSCEKARNVLGWAPRHTMTEGLRETIDWYREFFRKSETLRRFATSAS